MDGFLDTIAAIIQQQPLLALPVCFVGGIVSSASPCVLAMIPLVIGFVGGYAGGSQRLAVQYSLLFTLGLTVTFTILGLVAAGFGRLFGDIGAFWTYVLPVIAIVLGLQLLGIFDFGIGLPQRLMTRLRTRWGAMVAGLFFGIAASPCATPVLGVILTFTAVQREIAYGGVLLLAYALGHWVLVLGAGMSTAFAQRLIESKRLNAFSNWSRKVAGILVTGAGVYLLALAIWRF